MSPPATLPEPSSWPVSGLTSLDASPSHAYAQWYIDETTLAYRCGGSTGIGVGSPHLISRLTERLSPDSTLKRG